MTLVILFVVLGTSQIYIPPAESDADKLFDFLLINNIVISVFIGVYVGGGLFKLKTCYLWTINRAYRYSVITAFLTITGIFSLFQATIMAVHLPESKIFLLLPICIAIFSAYLVLGETLIHKIIIPTIPFGISQLKYWGVHIEILMLLIILSTLGLLYYLFNYGTQQSKPIKENLNTIFMGHPTPSKPFVYKFNFWLANIASPLFLRSPKDISWTVSLPQTKLAAAACFYMILIILNTLMIDDVEGKVIDVFLIILMGTILLAVFMEARQLITQTRSIAHLFSPKDNKGIKSEILKAINKNILVNCLVLLVLVSSFISIIGTPPDLVYLTASTAAVIAIGTSFYPFMLCLNWQNVSFGLVLSITILAFTIFAACYWLKQHQINEWLTIESLVFMMVIITIHQLSRLLYYRFPFEKLLINK